VIDHQGGKYTGALLFGAVKSGQGKWVCGEYFRVGKWTSDEFESGKCRIDMRGALFRK
jgi:hypothetical protein